MGSNPFDDDDDGNDEEGGIAGGQPRPPQQKAGTNPFDDFDDFGDDEAAVTTGSQRTHGESKAYNNPFEDDDDEDTITTTDRGGKTGDHGNGDSRNVGGAKNPFDSDTDEDDTDTQPAHKASKPASSNPFDDESSDDDDERKATKKTKEKEEATARTRTRDSAKSIDGTTTKSNGALQKDNDDDNDDDDDDDDDYKRHKRKSSTTEVADRDRSKSSTSTTSVPASSATPTKSRSLSVSVGMVTATESMRMVKATFSRLGGKVSTPSDAKDAHGADGGDSGGSDAEAGRRSGNEDTSTSRKSNARAPTSTKQQQSRPGQSRMRFDSEADDGDIETKLQANAVREVMMMLPSVEVLRFLPKLQATVNARVTSTESELHMMARSQVEEAHAVLSLLNESLNTSESLNIATTKLIDTLGTCTSLFNEEDPQSLMTQLSMANTSLRKVMELCEAILTFPYEAEEVEAMIEVDGDLMNAHEALVGLQFHAEALDRAAFLSIKGHHNTPDYPDTSTAAASQPFADFEEGGKQYEVVRSFLERLSKTNAIFEHALFEYFTNMDGLAKREPALLVRAIRIIEKQELIDMRLTKMKKNYKEKAFATMKETLQARFSALTMTLQTKDSDAIIQLLESMTIGLTNTYDFVVPCFPESYNIFSFILDEYDRHYTKMFADFCLDDSSSPSDDEPGGMFESFSNGDIKRLLMWLTDYQEQQLSLGIAKPFLGSVLEESRVNDLVRFDARRRNASANNGSSDVGGRPSASSDATGGGGVAAAAGAAGGGGAFDEKLADAMASANDDARCDAIYDDDADEGDPHTANGGGKTASARTRDDLGDSVATMSIADILGNGGGGSGAQSGSKDSPGQSDSETDKATHRRRRTASGSGTFDEAFILSPSSLAAASPNAPRFSAAERGFLTMIDVYVDRMQKLLSTWFSNLLVIDSGTIPKRSETTGKLYTPACVEIFGIIDDQIAVVTDVDKSWWLYKAIDAVLVVMDSFQSKFHDGLKKLEAQGFESCIAGINNAVRCYEYAQDMSEHIEEILPAHLFDLLDFESTYMSFLDTAKDGIPMVSGCIFEDTGFVQVLKRLFKTDDWYRGDVTEIIIATLKDYLDDVSSFVEDILRPRLMEAVLERVVGVNFEMLLANCKDCLKNRPIETINRMEADSSLLRDFFCKYMELDKIEKTISPLDSMRELVAAEEIGDVIMSYTLILQAKPNFQPQYVETLLSSRSDITKKERAELMEQCDERWQSSLEGGGGASETTAVADKFKKQKLKQKMLNAGKRSLIMKSMHT